MPDIAILIMIILSFAFAAIIAPVEFRIGAIGIVLFIGLSVWLGVAGVADWDEHKELSRTDYQCKVVDDIPIIIVDGEMVELGKVFNRNIKEGTIITKIERSRWSGGVYWVASPKAVTYEIKEASDGPRTGEEG